MAADPFRATGYKDSLLFNPQSGVIKYGSYEFMADKVGVPVSKQTYSFEAFKQSLANNPTGFGVNKYSGMNDKQLRQIFEQNLSTNSIGTALDTKNNINPQNLYQRSPDYYVNSTQQNRNVNVVPTGPDTYDVTAYNIPNDIEFVNKLNAESSRLSQSAQQGNVTDPNRPAGQSGRLGKPNYSRAASILAGESGQLGGATTQLGA